MHMAVYPHYPGCCIGVPGCCCTALLHDAVLGLSVSTAMCLSKLLLLIASMIDLLAVSPSAHCSSDGISCLKSS